jgi:hypothetical protein
MIKVYKFPKFYVPKNIIKIIMIESARIINVLKEIFILPRQAFAYIYKLHNYGQYKLHGSVINVPTNIDRVQSILLRLPDNDLTCYKTSITI